MAGRLWQIIVPTYPLKDDGTSPLNALWLATIPVGGDYFVSCPLISGLAMWLALASWVSGSDICHAWADIFGGIVRFCHCSFPFLTRMAGLRWGLLFNLAPRIKRVSEAEHDMSHEWVISLSCWDFSVVMLVLLLSQHSLPKLTDVWRVE